MGTYPRQDVLMTRAISLRSRVPGNWQARFWRPVERGDPSAEFNEGTHRGQQWTPALTLPQVRYGLRVLLLEVCCPLASTPSTVSVLADRSFGFIHAIEGLHRDFYPTLFWARCCNRV